jgi:hypothetical protein
MKSRIHITIIICAISFSSFAQIGIGTTSPDASSVLDMTSTTQGVLIPRMTTTQRAAIATPVIGLQVYDTDTKSVWSYNGAAWANGTGGPGQFIEGAATDIAYYDGRVGIGLNNFSTAHKLFVDGPKSSDGINTAARINATYTGTGTSTSATAVAAVATNFTTGTISTAIGTQNIVENTTAGGTITFGVGSWQRVINPGAMADASGLLSLIENTGTITRGYSQNIGIFNNNGLIEDARASYVYMSNFGTMTQAYGLYLDYFDFDLGTVTDSYALYIHEDFNDGTNDNFAIYSNTPADSYFNGNIGIGTTDPQQKVHISGAMRLEPQATPPAGTLGDLYVGTDGNLYFNDGSPGTGWRQVSLVP